VAFYGRGVTLTESGAKLTDASGELLAPLNRPGGLTLELDVARSEPRALRWSFNARPIEPMGHAHSSGALTFSIDKAWVKRGVNVLGVDSRGPAPSLVIRSFTLIEDAGWPPEWTTVYERERGSR
jgi:hypothetical protein